MHLPDGFLDPRLCLATAVVSAGAVGAALRRVRVDAGPALTARMGLTAAYVFAAQMINFPVGGGTSGHLLGAALSAVLLGPHAATVVMAAVFVIQTFFFLDGGHTALGANFLNMGLAGTYGGYAVFRAIAGPLPAPRRGLWAVAAAAWFSVMTGASLTAAELALSGTISAARVFPPMLAVHAVIGAGEAAITAAAVGLLWKVRPDLLSGREAPSGAGRRWAWAGAAGLVAAAALAPLASSAPDGLETVAERLGFAGRAAAPAFAGPFPDYTLPGLGETAWAPLLVSVIGSALMMGALVLAGRAWNAASEIGEGRPAPVDPRVRFGGLLAVVVTAVLLPADQAGKLLLLGAAATGTAWLSRVSLRWLAGRALLLLPFIGLAALSLPELRSGHGVPHLGLAFLRAGVSLLATSVFVATTTEPEALAAMSAFGLPRALAETIAFALRYLRVLMEEAARMLQARTARSAGSGTLALRAGVTGGIIGSLFIRSYERAERTSQAMAARGYQGMMPLRDDPRLTGRDGAFLLGMGLFLAGVWLWR